MTTHIASSIPVSGNFKNIRPVGNRISTGPAASTPALMQQLDQLVAAVVPVIRSSAR